MSVQPVKWSMKCNSEWLMILCKIVLNAVGL